MSEPIKVVAWSEKQFLAYVQHTNRRILIPRKDYPERPEVGQEIRHEVCIRGGYVSQDYKIEATPDLVQIKREPVNLKFEVRGKNGMALARWCGYLKSRMHMEREMPPNLFPAGEWREFWLAPVQLVPRVAEVPPPVAAAPIPPAPSKRGPGRPRKEK